MSQKPTKVPGIPKVPNDVSPLTRNFLNSLVEALEIRLGRRGDPKDRAITLRELVASGLAKELRSTPFDPNNITSSSIGVAPSRQEINTNVPPTPVGLVAAGAYSVINLSWVVDSYPNHSFTEVWSASVDNLAEAIFIGASQGFTYTDSVGSDESRYYWIRFVSQSNIAGPYNSTAGTFAQTAVDVEYLLAQLAASITASELHTDLSTPIGNLPDDTTQAIADLKTETDELIDAVNLDIDGVKDDIDDINESITDLGTAVSAEIDADILALNTTIDEDIASLKSETEGLIDEARAEINAIRNTPDWAAESDYLIGDLVKHDGKLYAAKVDHTSAADDGPADSEDNWALVGEYGSLIDVLVQTEATRATLSTDYYTKTDADSAISTATTGLAAETKFADYTTTADLETNYYTKTDADSAISTATTGLAAETKFADYTTTADLETNYYTKTDADSAISTATTGLAAETKFADYTTTADLETNYYTKTDADSAISTATTGLAAETKFADYTTTADLETNYYTKTDADSAISTATTGLAAETKFADYTTTADLETNYYTKTDADSAISTATTGLAAETKFADYTTTADLETNYYTKTDADSAISTATTGLAAETKFADYTTTADLETNYYTKTDADSAISTATTGLAAETKFADYTTTADLETNYYTKTDADSAISTATTGLAAETKFADYTTTADLETNYYTKTDADSAISTATTGLAAETKFADYTTTADLETNYYTKTDADSAISTATTGLAAETKFADYTTTADLETNYYTKTDADSAISTATTGLAAETKFADYTTTADLETNYYTKTDADSAISTATSGLAAETKFADYTTTADLETNYYTKTDADSAISTATTGLAAASTFNDYTNTADLQSNYYTKTDADSAIAESTQQLRTEVDGELFIADQSWVFTGSNKHGFTAIRGTVTGTSTHMVYDENGSDASLNITNLSIDGFTNKIVRMVIKRVEGGSDWQGWLRYSSDGSPTVSFSNQQTYRAIGNTTVTGEYVTLEWDMTDRPHWDNTLKQFRFDLGNNGNSKWHIKSIEVGATTKTLNAAVQAQMSSIDGLSASYTVKTDVNGYVAGFGLASTTNDSGQITSEFIVNADRFAIARGGSDDTAPSVPFVVQATATDDVPAGVYMDAAFIKNASITAAKIGSVDADTITSGSISADRIGAGTLDASEINIEGTGGTLNIKSAASGSRMEMTSSAIKVFDGNTLRVQLGDLSE